jgi:large subunit ribosomal protein L17
MRHGKHQHTLVSTQEHRRALLSNLAAALFTHGRIRTTLAKAKGLRPFAEKVITLAKKAAVAKDNKALAIHLKRLALTYVRDEDAVSELFKNRASEFAKRSGGYTRIYKLGRRVGDAGEMALIELVPASDEGRKPRSKRTAAKPVETPKAQEKAPATEEAKAPAKEKKVAPKAKSKK